MSPRVRRLFIPALGFALVSGCTHPHSTTTPADYRVTSLPRSAPHPSGPAFPVATRAPATTRTPVARVTVPGEPFTRADPAKPFTPALVVTTQTAHGDLFFASMLGAGPGYHQARRVFRGQRAFVLPFAENYAIANSDRRADITFEITLQKADKSPDGPPLSGVLWQDKVNSPNQLLLAGTVVNFVAEKTDPLGECQLTVRLQDHLGGDDATLTHTVLVEDYVPPSLPATFSPEQWLEGYYQAPSPELSLPALGPLFDKLSSVRRGTALPLIVAFYDQILSDNTWLLPAFYTRLATAGPNEAYALSVALGFHLRKASAAPADCPADVWQRLDPFRTHTWPDPDTAITDPTQLDCLWGRFFASGLYAPLYRLFEPLTAVADLGTTDRYAAEHLQTAVTGDPPPPPPDIQAAIAREQLMRASIWTLNDNSRRHPLVRAYLDLTVRTAKVSDPQLAVITRILQPDKPAADTTPATAIVPGAN